MVSVIRKVWICRLVIDEGVCDMLEVSCALKEGDEDDVPSLVIQLGKYRTIFEKRMLVNKDAKTSVMDKPQTKW